MVVCDARFLLVTANVGSIFEDTDRTLNQWLRKCLKAISRISPMFLAIHCQEVGGKNYEATMHHVEHFVKTLLSAPALQRYDRIRMFLDEDFTAEEKFTALGNLYFIHESLGNVQIWDFKGCTFVPLTGKMVHSGNIESISTMEKHKFPFGFFPESQWSRKGYIRTRWLVANQKFELVNIHLFHDASNLTAIESSPSKYSCYRRDALNYVLDRLDNDGLERLPRFMFGDFNFRLDTFQLVRKLLENAQVNRIIAKKHGKLKRLQYTFANQVLLTVEPKFFEHHDHDRLFRESVIDSLLEFDCEPVAFRHRVFEFPIRFPPSYPFTEDVSDGQSYMRTRCPSWCDRIMLSHGANGLVLPEAGAKEACYYVIGDKVCMGDHKPVYLAFRMNSQPPGLVEAGDAAAATANPGAASAETTPAAGDDAAAVPTVCVREHKPLRPVISINGEDVAAEELSTVSFLCNATFEKEHALSSELRLRIDRKAFRDVAKSVLVVSSTVRRWRSSAALRSRRRGSGGSLGGGFRQRCHSSSSDGSRADNTDSGDWGSAQEDDHRDGGGGGGCGSSSSPSVCSSANGSWSAAGGESAASPALQLGPAHAIVVDSAVAAAGSNGATAPSSSSTSAAVLAPATKHAHDLLSRGGCASAPTPPLSPP